MSGVKLLTVSADEGEQRLDRWFKRRFPQLTQGAVEKMCRTGQVRVDGARAKANDRVVPGQVIRVPPLPENEAPSRPRPDGVSAADEKMIQDCVIFKDEHIIVLNKPAGLPSQGGSGQGSRHVDGLTEMLKFGYNGGIAGGCIAAAGTLAGLIPPSIAMVLYAMLTTQPADWDRLFPGTGGALYGRATHGWKAAFQRPGAASRLPGLYLAGGGIHPGAGIPMASLSGRLAAERLLADLPSMRSSRRVAMPGGTSTR